jgi:hypothetical protein
MTTAAEMSWDENDKKGHPLTVDIPPTLCPPSPMTRARLTLVSLSDPPWYHGVCYCLRRACLCGKAAHTGRNF